MHPNGGIPSLHPGSSLRLALSLNRLRPPPPSPPFLPSLPLASHPFYFSYLLSLVVVMSESMQHIPLLDDTESNSKNFEHQHDCVCDREYARRTDRHIILLWFWITLQIIVIVCLVGIIFIYREGPCPADRCENIYPQGLYCTSYLDMKIIINIHGNRSTSDGHNQLRTKEVCHGVQVPEDELPRRTIRRDRSGLE